MLSSCSTPPNASLVNALSFSSFTSQAHSNRVKMSSDSHPHLPESRIVVGVGGISVDFLATVAAYPKPDDKIRSTSLKVGGGGNAGNALTCASRLGLNARLITKVADDSQGKGILDELQADGVDTSFMVVSEGGNSPFTYVIVDEQTKTRTCINTPGYPPMIPDELSQSSLSSALDGARIVYSDVRLHETALVIAQEAWTEAPSVPSALVSILLRLPNIKFVIVTLGEDGCIMLERSANEDPQTEEIDVDSLLELLKQQKDDNTAIPTCVSSSVTKLRANKFGTVHGRLIVGTAEKIPPSELVDTTGAGDAFIGAVLYAEKMLPFAAQVAAACCRGLGARTALPHGTDPRLASFLMAAYPKPDDKIRSTSSKALSWNICFLSVENKKSQLSPQVEGGGNAGNALTCASRLGLNARLISNVADDSQGKSTLDEFQADGVDTSFIVVSKGGISPFTYIIVDEKTKTRTGILTPGYPPMIPDDLSRTSLLSAFDGARIVYFDLRFQQTALAVAQEAARRNIPILIDAEKESERLDDLLKLADYVVCSAKFPQQVAKLGANKLGTVNGRLIVGTAEKIPPSELLDTTGAGDAFIGAVLYAICTNMPAEKMLPFAAQVVAGCCRGLGAQSGLPYRTDPRLASFLS
ncbi:hypothetical protein FEM48_Zijuj09G0068100 [Ziziphus jujuba var. spinosa]|uniref:Carbohydrate kinase PfkB domain-containing protein n=1 Tax=Ziziphus jujuba var. spinosa TaxID=714518 RepID=A0A978URG8_ZIZJJ|nr:hypothetical protein FEM48_Zijuj09G0068100 [Ziziphus jujuba var. spinosa]